MPRLTLILTSLVMMCLMTSRASAVVDDWVIELSYDNAADGSASLTIQAPLSAQTPTITGHSGGPGIYVLDYDYGANAPQGRYLVTVSYNPTAHDYGMSCGITGRQLSGNQTGGAFFPAGAGAATQGPLTFTYVGSRQANATDTCTSSSCRGGGGAGAAPGAAQSNGQFSVHPLRYGDGSIKLQVEDLASAGMGGWGLRRSYSNNKNPSLTDLGKVWFIDQRPFLVIRDSEIDLYTGANGQMYAFGGSLGTYTLIGSGQETLTTGTGEFIFTDSFGNQTHFFDGSATPARKIGQFSSFSDAASNPTAATYDSSGYLTKVESTVTTGGVTSKTTYNYHYNGSGLIYWIEQQLTVGATTNTIRQVTYEYYGGTSGEAGENQELKRVTIQDASGTPKTLEQYYYRYYRSSGQVGLLKYVLNPVNYARMVANGLDPTNTTTVTDTTLAGYADNYFEYSSATAPWFVSKDVVGGAGCSCSSGGLGTFTYALTVNSGGSSDYNVWANKNVETQLDVTGTITLSTKTVYTNYVAQPIMEVLVADGVETSRYFEYDSGTDALVRVAESSAINAGTYPDSTGGVTLKSSAGLIRHYTFATSTTATSTTAGNVAGLLQSEEVLQGTGGTPITTRSQTYIAHTAGGVTIYPLASQTVYHDTVTTTGAETTTYTYPTWQGSTNQVYEKDTSHPVISSTQNGPGTADVEKEIFDAFGRMIWKMDADGRIFYNQYDDATGSVSKHIDDVNTGNSGDFANLPSGWTSGTSPLHLITSYVLDGLGRSTRITSPSGNATFIVYIDAPVTDSNGIAHDHEVRTYPGWNFTTHQPTGPTQIHREVRGYNYVEDLTMQVTPLPSGVDAPDGSELIGNIQTLSRTFLDGGGRTRKRHDFYNVSGLTYAVSDTDATPFGDAAHNWHETLFGYDSLGEQCRIVNAVGTRHRTVHDGRRRVLSEWVGTTDTPTSGEWSPTNNGSGCNMVMVRDYQYEGSYTDGNLTQVTDYPTAISTDNRIRLQWFDWRDRLMAVKDGYQTTTENTSVNRPITYYDLDNEGRTTAISRFDADGVGMTVTSGVPVKPSTSLMRAYVDIFFDDQGREYSREVHGVTSSGVKSSNSLKTMTWYNQRGLVVKSSRPGGLVTKRRYDGVGRVVMIQQTDGGGDTAWAHALDAGSDNVLVQEEMIYDSDGDVIQHISKERNHDETATGDLGDALSTPAAKCRKRHTVSYFDKADRLTDTVDYGTGCTAISPSITFDYSRPSSPPSRSDTALVTSLTYNTAGWVELSTDPRSIVSKRLYDALGRTTSVIEGYDAAVNSGNPSGANNRTTVTTYDGLGHVTSLQAVMPTGTNSQTTAYVYGVTTASGSVITSNDLLGLIKYPSKTAGTASSLATNHVQYTFNALGQMITNNDCNNSTHTYLYDVLGRLVSDSVSSLGSGVDGAVRRIEIAYNDYTLPYLYTSYNASTGGTVLNQVQRTVNSLAQLTTEYQEHSGSVNTSSSLAAGYGMTGFTTGNNFSRPDTLTFPNGRILHYYYATGVNADISRIYSLNDDDGSGGRGNEVERYNYLGLYSIIQVTHTEPGRHLYYQKLSAEPVTDAGDQYTGLDRFGRVLDQRWRSSAGTITSDRFQYGYDRDGEKLYKNNVVTANESELYHANSASAQSSYDPLGRMTEFRRGTLTGSLLDTVTIGNVNDPNTADPIYGTQAWSLDQTNNWGTITSDSSSVTRTHNCQNQLTGDGTNTYAYDDNGNLTTQTNQTTNVYDAWNRAVGIRGTTYVYDALGRRIKETSGGTTRHFYYDGWQIVETRLGSNTKPYEQFVYSRRYIDAVVLRDRDSDANGSTGTLGNLPSSGVSGLEERLYYQQDANYNVTSLVNTSGTVVERMTYDPYGDISYFDAAWTSRTGSSYANNVGFTGRWHDATGMVYFRGRMWEPVLGRFVQRDPIGYQGGGMSLYAGYFVPNGMDPDGRRRIQIAFDAFINGDRGAWLPEPSVVPYYDNGNRFSTDNRGFGEFNFSKESPNARVSSFGWVESTKIGDLGDGDFDLGSYTGFSHEAVLGRYVQEARAPINNPRPVIRNSYSNDYSTIEFSPSANYPFVSYSPSINYSIKFILEKKCPDHVKVTVIGTKNTFPDYEAYVDNDLVFKQRSWSDGPSPYNLGIGVDSVHGETTVEAELGK